MTLHGGNRPLPEKNRTTCRADRERGFALLIVLWTLVFLAFLMTQILTTGRTAVALAGDLRGAAEARAAADGAIYEALFHVLSTGADHWPSDGSLRTLNDSGVTVSVRVESLANKINPNLASTALLAGLLQAVGAAPAQAARLAGAVTDWRSQAATKQAAADELAAYRRGGYRYGPPGRPFADLGELGDVIGMPPSLLAKALPEMSLYQSDDPDPTISDGVVQRALILSGQPGSSSSVYDGSVPVVSIEAEAEAPGGVTAHRKAIVSIGGSDAPEPFSILLLTDG